MGLIQKDIKGYSGLYQIDNMGTVYSSPRMGTKGGVMKSKTNTWGYIGLKLSSKGTKKYYSIHRLVALHFVDGYFEGAHVNHIDKDRTNNHPTNLEWVTQQYNNEYSISKSYLITHPCGKEEIIFNLASFCRFNKLDDSNLVKVSKGKAKHHKGFKCSYMEEK